MTKQFSNLSKTILNKIESGKAKMKPKWHFILKTTLAVLGICLVSLTTLFLTSFVFFSLRQTGVLFAPHFGFRGMAIFLFSLPILLILLSMVFIVVLEILARRYSFIYRKPLLYSAIGIIVLVLLGGFLVSKTRMHHNFFESSERGNFPIGNSLYKDFGRNFGMKQPKDITLGVVVNKMKNGFTMENRNGEILNVVFPHSSPNRDWNFNKDDRVLIFGERIGDNISASGTQKMDEELIFPRRDFRKRR